MSEAVKGIVILWVLPIVVSIIVHAYVRYITRATLLSATISTIMIQVLSYLELGYLDPFFLIAVGLGWCWAYLIAFVVGFFFLLARKPLPQAHPQCQRCGYNLTGNVTGICPECGTEVKA